MNTSIEKAIRLYGLRSKPTKRRDLNMFNKSISRSLHIAASNLDQNQNTKYGQTSDQINHRGSGSHSNNITTDEDGQVLRSSVEVRPSDSR